MSDRDYDREQRWKNVGPWSEDTDDRDDMPREGDRDMARSYDREDQRRYGRKSQDQAERLRSLRGQQHPDRQEGSRPEGRGAGSDDARGYRGGRAEEDRRDAYTRGGPEGYDPGQGPGADRMDNYWGRRRQQEEGRPRPGVTSARRGASGTGMGGPGGGTRRAGGSGEMGPSDGWDDSGYDYDMDPGYAYEFGTSYQYQFLNDEPLDEARRRLEEDRARGRSGRAGQSGAGNRGTVRAGTGQRREAWQEPGPYTGMGPKGYRRSDERIRDEVCETLTRCGQVDAREISVEVREGQVVLSGLVNRRDEKHIAEDLAAGILGVQDVENQIRVQKKDQ